MANLTDLSLAQKAVLLIYKGLSPRASALRGDSDYQHLLALWRADPEFRALVEALAPMLELRVIDVLDNAIVLAPCGPDSVFAATVTDLRARLNDMSRAMLAIIHVGIAATFFPTAAALAGNDEGAATSATPERIASVLHGHCQTLERKTAGDPRFEEAGLVEVWREIARLPDARPDSSRRAGLGSLIGQVKLVLNQLQEHGMVQTEETEQGETYFPTPRYRLQVRELAANELFSQCMAEMPGFLAVKS